MNTPGAALEWAASDGRRGRLVRKGKMRGLGSPSREAVDSKGSSGPGTISRVAGKCFAKTDGKDAKSEKEANKYTSGQTNDASELEYKRVPSKTWTEDQDKVLFRMKFEQKPWGEITKEFGKTKQECNDRWKEIMPEGFYNNQNKGGDKSGDKGKHDKGKDKKQKQEGQKKAEPEASSGGDALGVVGWDMFAAPEDNKSNAPGGNAKNETVVNTSWDNPAGGGVDTGGTAGGANTWNTENNNNTGAAENGSWNFGNGNDDTNEKNENGENGKKPPENGGQNESRKPNSTAGGNEWTENNWGGADGGIGADATAAWGEEGWGGGDGNDTKSNGKVDNDNGSGDRGNGNGDNNKNASGGWNTNDNDKAGGQSWGGAASPKKSSSRCDSKDHKKHRSSERSFRRDSESKDKHKSHHHHGRSHQAEYKVAPDDTFSQDELKLVARILQQDSFMVWERVSWRFKDKTGRHLDPDVFEKKITGRVEKEQH